jgi:hypothetical protein
LILIGSCFVMIAAVLNATGSADLRVRLSAGGAALALFGAGLVQPRINAVLERRHQDKIELDRSILTPSGKPPLVRNVVNPLSLGVHAAARSGRGSGTDGGLPPYVPRDIDRELRQALTSSRFILLVGPAAAGKTRTGYEAIRAVLPDHTLIAPDSVHDIPAAMAAARGARDCVLWLDGLQRYLGASAVTSKSIYRLLAGKGHHRIVLATLRAMEETRLIRISESMSGEQLTQDGRAVLDLVDTRIVVDREFSNAEKLLAIPLAAHDSRLADALRHVDRYGVPEYLSSGPQLAAEWDNAWERGAHPRGAAVVAAAVDCRRAGFAAPLPLRLLRELGQQYIAQRGGPMLRPEPFADALAWAISLRDSANSLLWPTGNDCYGVFDYLVDRRGELDQQVPEWTARAALQFAGPADAVMIAATAWYQERPELAAAGFRSAYTKLQAVEGPDAAVTLTCRSDLAVVLHALGRLTDAEAECRAVLDRRASTLGANHPETLTSRNNLAVILQDQGRLAEAENHYRVVVTLRSSKLGARHPSVLVTRNNLGALLTQHGRLNEAVAELEEVVRLREMVLGADHPHTVHSRHNLDTARRKLSGG